jgi:acetoin utilization protein AcuB
MTTAYDVMTKNPVTIPMTARIRDAVRLLQTLDVRHLPVVDEQGALVGMVSDRDLGGLSFPEVVGAEYIGRVQGSLEATVASVMSSDVLSVSVEADVSEIVDLMLDFKIGAVPVVNSDDALVGIVSYVDLLRQIPVDDDDAPDGGEPAYRTRN